MIIVGSTALKYFGINRAEPKDLDTWVSLYDPLYRGNHDIHKITPKIYSLIPTVNGYATPDAIFTIKCSHFPYDVKWEKTKKDILWLKAKGCKILPNLYKELKKLAKVEHGNKDFLSLKQTSASFFNDHVDYVYDHDYLHELVAWPNPPIYTQCLAKNEAIFIDKEKFFSMSKVDQLQMFKEEITVIAVERWMVHGRANWLKAYHLALKKTITRLTKNWATDFIIDNLDFYAHADYSYFKYILKILNLENKNMSSIEDTFKALYEEMDVQESLEEVVYMLAEGDDWFSSNSITNYEKAKRHVQGVLDSWGYEKIKQEGGGEGGAEYCEAVFKLKDKYYHVEYEYYSHEGHRYHDILHTLKEVTPRQETVTVFD